MGWGVGAASWPCAHPTGAHQPRPAAPCGVGPLLAPPARPTAALSPLWLCRLSSPPASAAAPLFPRLFPQPGVPPPCPRPPPAPLQPPSSGQGSGGQHGRCSA